MKRADLDRFLDAFSGIRVLVMGDIMLDRFIRGSVSRISPEAPVPVVAVQEDEYFPGGAANVARNLGHFSSKVGVAGVIGDDIEGTRLREILASRDIDGSSILVDSRRPTTLKTRIVARGQQVVRFDHEATGTVGPDHVREVSEILARELPSTDAVILQDYGKGFLTQALVDAVVSAATEHGVIVTADPNPNNPLHWNGVTAVKPNRLEAFKAAGLVDKGIDGPPDEDPGLRKVAGRLFENWKTETLLVTLGELGMVVFHRDGEAAHIPSRAREVFDVSGAGDTAIALFTLGLAAGANPVEAAEISNFASAVVVAKSGTATLSPEELRGAVDRA